MNTIFGGNVDGSEFYPTPQHRIIPLSLWPLYEALNADGWKVTVNDGFVNLVKRLECTGGSGYCMARVHSDVTDVDSNDVYHTVHVEWSFVQSLLYPDDFFCHSYKVKLSNIETFIKEAVAALSVSRMNSMASADSQYHAPERDDAGSATKKRRVGP